MKFGIIGSHCSAKTTTVNYVLQYLKRNGIKDVMTRAEVARRSPYPLDKDAKKTFKLQFWITSETIRKELELEPRCEHLICDRTVVDQVVYGHDARRRKQITPEEFKLIYVLAKNWLEAHPYDVTYLLYPAELYADSVRPLDHTWQETIWRYFKWWTPRLLGEWGFITIKHPHLDKRMKMVAMDIKAKIRNPPCSVMGRG